MPDDHDAYADFLTRPVWPKRHRTRLGSSYAGSSREELEAEKSSRERHLPGRQSVSNGLKRHAGTSGEIYDGAPHPDDFDNDQQQALVQAVINGLSQKDQLPADEKQELLKAIQDASRPEQVRDDFLKLFKDPRIVISAREAKELTPDFGHALGHSRKHGHARYSLPISESELKDQEWPGKEEQRKKQEEENTQKKQGEDSKAKQPAESQEGGNTNEDQQESKQGGVSASDQKVNREQDEGAEEGEPVENLTPEQRRFFDALVEEAKQINAFHNSDGQPGPAVEDAAGTSQVGYEIQIDDQFTPDVRKYPFLTLFGSADLIPSMLTELDTSQQSSQAIDGQAPLKCRGRPARTVRCWHDHPRQAALCQKPRRSAQTCLGDAQS